MLNSYNREGEATLNILTSVTGKQRFWEIFVRYRLASIIVGPVIVMTVLTMVQPGGLLRAFAQSSCAKGDQVYVVQQGDTLGAIASRYSTAWQQLASYNKLANPNTISVDQNICIPGISSSGYASAKKGGSNPYPYPACTWWADDRFHQLHNFYVPWRTNANAYQWKDRAAENGWRVSGSPTVGSIIDLQPGVQGAGYLGHVGLVEQVLSNGHVIASSMSWGAYPNQVTDWQFAPGSGVTFLSAS